MAGKVKKNTGFSHTPNPNNIAVMRQEYSGPLPPPSILEAFERIYPGSAKLIIDNVMEQSLHRRSLESIVVKSGSRDSLLGILCAFIMGMTLIIGSVICILNNKEAVGLSLGGLGLSGLVGAFIYGTNQNRKEREAKAKMIHQ